MIKFRLREVPSMIAQAYNELIDDKGLKMAASLIVLFVWIYYSGLILFFGAELTQLYRKSSAE